MRQRSRTGLLGILLTVALVVAACGDDAAPDTTTGGADDTTAETTATTPDDTAATTPDTTAGTDTTPAPSDGEPIRIGALTSLTETFTPWGVHVRDGMQLAVDEINAQGGVDGRMLELVLADDQSNPEAGVEALERMVEQDGVVAVGGIISSDVALATSRAAEELEMPLFLIKAGSEQILTQDSRYTFRTCLPSAPMVGDPILQYAQDQGMTSIGAIIADYAWGQAMSASLEDTFAEASEIELQIEVAPVPEQDFTTYLRSLEGIAPEMIVATGHPPGSGAITIQSADLGFDVPVTGAYTPFSLIMGGGVAEAAVARYADFKCADHTSEDYQELARRYVEMSENPFMDDDAVAGYGIVTMVAQAVGEAGDDPVAIAEYLHGQSFDLPGYMFEMAWTEWGELSNATIAFDIVGEGPAPEGTNSAGDWYPERLFVSEPLEPYVPGS
ncbi:MAG TPA: ABC transporter substrate-binding protein [Acidimicrobiia bacterium]|nr:ABC transporter substrate-binding protein [Acidimicrobiia bacterium]